MKYTKAQQKAEKAGKHFSLALFTAKKHSGRDYPAITICGLCVVDAG